jgi:hypothetical protein
VLPAVEIAAHRPSLSVLISAGCSGWQPISKLLVGAIELAIDRPCRI